MERLRLGTTGAELIKNRPIFLSRRTSARNPTALLRSARREKQQQEKGRQMEHVEPRPNSKRKTVGYYFPSFERKMKGYDGGFHAC